MVNVSPISILEKVENVWPDYSCDQLIEQNCPPWGKENCKKSYQSCGSQKGKKFDYMCDE